MAVKKILTKEHPILTKKCEPIQTIEKEEIQLLQDLEDTLSSTTGVGIAAPQIGILKRAIVICYEDKIYRLFNPVIVDKTGVQTYYEGCLSVDSKEDYCYGKVKRSYKIKVQAINENNEFIEIIVSDVLAVIFQHEIDHLEGKIYLDKVIGELLHFKTNEQRKKWKQEANIHEIIDVGEQWEEERQCELEKEHGQDQN